MGLAACPRRRQRGLRLTSVVAAALALSWPAEAAADPPPPMEPATAVLAFLAWDDGAATLGCPAGERIAADIDGLLGRPATTDRTKAAVVVKVRFEGQQVGWVAHIGLARPGGEPLGQRILDSADPDCAALAGPIALVVALAIEAATPEAREVRLTVPVTAPRAPTAETEWRAQSRGEAVASGGLLPGFALGARLSLGLVPPGWWPLHVAVTLWPEVEKVDEERGGRFSAWHAGLSVCPPLATSETGAISLCAGADAGMMSATGVGLDYTASPSRFIALGHTELAAYLRLGGPFSLGVQAGAAVPFVRPRFVYTGHGGEPVEVHRSWPVLPQGAFSLGFEIPPVW
ncbi:MAG: hypothetical protein JRI68_12010 [Deltaproteobacteria bacterium]|nr:hypothetical protein [Deltaproteobacteria bacterium]